MPFTPIDNESDALNYVTVNGVKSPGKAHIHGLNVPYKWDIQDAYGRDAATMTFRGRGLAKFTLTLSLWKPSHFIRWPGFASLLEPPEKKALPFVVQMGHPVLTAAGLQAVTVESIGIPERQSNGLWISTTSCIEWRKPRDVLVKPKGSVPAVEEGVVFGPPTALGALLEDTRRRFASARDAAR